jgi:flagellar hook-length control protein FliK
VLAQFHRGQRAGVVGRNGAAASHEDFRVDIGRFVGRVARAIHLAGERGGPLQLRLSPPELGSLKLELTVQEGVLSATVEAETPAARRLLLEHLPALRDRLAEQNVRVERFDVDLRRDGEGNGSGATPQQPQDESQRQPARSADHHVPARHSAGTESPPDAELATAHISNSGINVFV